MMTGPRALPVALAAVVVLIMFLAFNQPEKKTEPSGGQHAVEPSGKQHSVDQEREARIASETRLTAEIARLSEENRRLSDSRLATVAAPAPAPCVPSPSAPNADNPSNKLPPAVIEFPPGVNRVAIQIGTWRNPVIPASSDTGYIGIDAEASIIHELRNQHQGVSRAFFVPAAIGIQPALASFFSSTNGQQSSSLSKTTQHGAGAFKQVPSVMAVVPLKAVIDAIPASFPIPYIMIDAQGHDLNVIKSAGASIQRVSCFLAEVVVQAPYYDGPDNRRVSFLEWAAANNFRLVTESCNGPNDPPPYTICKEANMLFRRQDVTEAVCLPFAHLADVG